MLRDVVTEHKGWARANFPGATEADAFTGMQEEAGEMCHAVLKMKQGIRTNQDHEADFMDGIGDFAIYMIHFCELVGVDFCRVVAGPQRVTEHDRQRRLRNLCGALASVHSAMDYTHGDMNHALVSLGNRLKEVCGSQYDFNGIVLETWAQVKERDWKENPETGRA